MHYKNQDMFDNIVILDEQGRKYIETKNSHDEGHRVLSVGGEDIDKKDPKNFVNCVSDKYLSDQSFFALLHAENKPIAWSFKLCFAHLNLPKNILLKVNPDLVSLVTYMVTLRLRP